MAQVLISETNLTNIANAIRNKNNTTTSYKPGEMAEAINGIVSGDIKLQEKAVTPTTSNQTITASSGYNGLSKVTINAVTSAIDSDIKASNIKKGVDILGITGTLEEGITPSGTLNITSNGTHDVTSYATANVNIPTAEDLSTELTEQEALLTTQETTLTDIMNALQGKTAGGGDTRLTGGVFHLSELIVFITDSSFTNDIPSSLNENDTFDYGTVTFIGADTNNENIEVECPVTLQYADTTDGVSRYISYISKDTDSMAIMQTQVSPEYAMMMVQLSSGVGNYFGDMPIGMIWRR